MARPPKPGYTLTVLSDVYDEDADTEDTGWLWPGRIPAGSIGVLDGDPGLGKSFVTMDLAARITRGAKWPDGQKGIRPSDVLLILAEDSRATVAKRLRAAGADFKRVAMLDDVKGKLPKLPDDISIVENIIVDRKVKLVIIDPFMAFFSVSAYHDQRVRDALTPLAKLAEKTGVVVLFVRHLTKAGGRNAKMAGGGTGGILGACRFGYMFAEDPDDPKARVMAVTKFNLDEEPESLEFRIGDGPHGTIVKWESETVKWTANDLMRRRTVDTEERKEQDEVINFLSTYLFENGGIASPVDLFKDGREAGFTQKMLRTAKKKLSVRSIKVGANWYWVENGYSRVTNLRVVP